jgi:hypothetical protein
MRQDQRLEEELCHSMGVRNGWAMRGRFKTQLPRGESCRELASFVFDDAAS